MLGIVLCKHGINSPGDSSFFFLFLSLLYLAYFQGVSFSSFSLVSVHAMWILRVIQGVLKFETGPYDDLGAEHPMLLWFFRDGDGGG